MGGAAERDVASPSLDAAVVAQLMDMGFPQDACKKAVYLTKNSGAEQAMSWIMEHMEDQDFSSPHPDLSTRGPKTTAKPAVSVDPNSVAQLKVC